MSKRYVVTKDFLDLFGQPVHKDAILTVIESDTDIYEASTDLADYIISKSDLLTNCIEYKEDKCESSLSESEISPAIKSWLSTLPRKV